MTMPPKKDAADVLDTSAAAPIDYDAALTAVGATKKPATAPKPKPGDADYDWSPHYDGADDLYRHTFANGTVVALKPFGSIYSKTWLYKIRAKLKDPNFTDIDVEFESLERAICPTANEVLLALDDNDGDPLDELWNAWIKAGTSKGDGDDGLTPGKSSG